MNSHFRAMFAVAAAALLWGTTGTAAAFAPSLSAVTIGAAAMGGGGVLQAAANARLIRRSMPALVREWRIVAIGAVCVVAYPLAFYTSMRVGGVALGSVVSLASAPLAAAIIERVTDARALTGKWMLACALGLIGSALLCVSQGGDAVGAQSALAGLSLGLLAGLTYAGYSWALRRLITDRHVSRGAAAGAILGLGGAVLLIIAAVDHRAVAGAPTSWLVIGYLAVVPMFAGYALFSRGLHRVDATTATTITLIEPAVATLLAVSVLSERITVLGWLGITLLGIALWALATPTAATSNASDGARSARYRPAVGA